MKQWNLSDKAINDLFAILKNFPCRIFKRQDKFQEEIKKLKDGKFFKDDQKFSDILLIYNS